MKKSSLKQHVPQDVALGTLLALLFFVCFVVVIPRLKSLQSVPIEYYNSLPVSQPFDTDRDGIPDVNDSTPYGVSDPFMLSGSGDGLEDFELLDSELEMLLSDEELEAELDFLLQAEFGTAELEQ